MTKFLENISEAEKTIKTANYLFYKIFPILRDKKLLLKILTDIRKSIVKCINLILQREYLFNRISLSKNTENNFKIFEDKCALKYGITFYEKKLIKELFDLIEKHKQSSFEFLKNGKLIILSEKLNKKEFLVKKTIN